MWDVFYNTLRLKPHPPSNNWVKNQLCWFIFYIFTCFTNSYLQQIHFHFFSFMTLYLKFYSKCKLSWYLRIEAIINLKTKVFHLVLSCPLATFLPSFYVWFFKTQYKKRKLKFNVCETVLLIFCQCFIGSIAFIDFISVKTTFIGCFRFGGCEVCAGRQRSIYFYG